MYDSNSSGKYNPKNRVNQLVNLFSRFNSNALPGDKEAAEERKVSDDFLKCFNQILGTKLGEFSDEDDKYFSPENAHAYLFNLFNKSNKWMVCKDIREDLSNGKKYNGKSDDLSERLDLDAINKFSARLIDIRQTIDARYTQQRDKKKGSTSNIDHRSSGLLLRSDTPIHKDDVFFIYYWILSHGKDVHANSLFNVATIEKKLKEITQNYSMSQNDSKDLIRLVHQQVQKDIGQEIPLDDGIILKMRQNLSECLQYSGKIIRPKIRLIDKFREIQRVYKENHQYYKYEYHGENPEQPKVHLAIQDQGLIYCLLATQHYGVTNETIVSSQKEFIQFFCELEDETENNDINNIDEIVNHPENHKFKSDLDRFLNSDEQKMHLVVALSSLKNIYNSHFVHIHFEKKQDSISIKVKDSAGNVINSDGSLNRPENPQDIKVKKIIKKMLPADKFTNVNISYIPVQEQDGDNCLIEAINHQVAEDLGLKQKTLTKSNVKFIRTCVKNAIDGNPIDLTNHSLDVLEKSTNQNIIEKEKEIYKQSVSNHKPTADIKPEYGGMTSYAFSFFQSAEIVASNKSIDEIKEKLKNLAETEGETEYDNNINEVITNQQNELNIKVH